MRAGDINYGFMDMSSLIRVGIHYGHKVTLLKSVMKPYILGNWHGINIINVDKTLTALEASLNVVFESICSNRDVLFLCNGLSYSRGIAQPLAEISQHCVIREFGGVVTNWATFKSVGDRIKRYNKIINIIKDKRLINYYNRRIERASRVFISPPELRELPGAVVLFCSSNVDYAVAEANKMRIPVIGLADSLSNVAGVDYVVPVCEGSDKVNSFLCELFAHVCSRAVLVSSRARLFGIIVDSGTMKLNDRATSQALAVICTHFKSTYFAFENVKNVCALVKIIGILNVRLMLLTLVSLVASGCVSLKTSIRVIINLCKFRLLKVKLSGVVSTRLRSLIRWLECVRCLVNIRSKVVPNRISMLYGKFSKRKINIDRHVPGSTSIKDSHIDYHNIHYFDLNVVNAFDYFFGLSE